ncbi:hypothetical protein K438DRAFT_2179563 [Mycena galopus ATCC 62051]|nr:hypothetical protein K438DRAFT_2179563 [Mycena galopus ATCC 62051]
MLLPNFTYAEFLKMVQHMEVRQRILLSGKFNLKRERDSGAGYIIDYDAKTLSSKDQQIAAGRVDDHDLNQLANLAFREAAQICRQLLHIAAPLPTIDEPLELAPLGCSLRKKKAETMAVDSESEPNYEDDSDVDEEIDYDSDDGEVEANSDASVSEITAAATLDTAQLSESQADLHVNSEAAPVALPEPSGPLLSKILDSDGKISIKLMVRYKEALQAGTTTHSEHVVSLNPKFALAQVAREADTEGKVPAMSIKEASHCVRIAQDLDSAFREDISNRGSEPCAAQRFLVMRTTERMYIGEVIDIFKKGSSGRYGSIELATTTSEIQALSLRVYLPLQTISLPSSDDEEDDDDDLNIPKFSFVASGAKYHLHTYAPIQTLVYHLGPKTLSLVAPTNSESPKGSLMGLVKHAGSRWMALSHRDVMKVLPPLKIKVPGAAAAKKAKKKKPLNVKLQLDISTKIEHIRLGHNIEDLSIEH